jgi:hypothetical protein
LQFGLRTLKISGSFSQTSVRKAYPMLRSFIDFVCGNEPMAFESDFSLPESVHRLTAEVKPPLLNFQPFVSLKTTVVVGEVSEEHVSLWCERLLVRNGFRPVFVGRFQTFGDRVILIGKMMGMNGLVPLFVVIGLAMSLFFIRGTLLELMEGPADPRLWLMPFAGVIPLLFVLGMVRLTRWLSSGDEDWILAAIQSALLESMLTSDARSGRL